MEEFESGAKPMEGVGTSTAGFVGLAERGPVVGHPQLVTNFPILRESMGDIYPIMSSAGTGSSPMRWRRFL